MNQEFLTCGSEYIVAKIQEAVHNGSRNAKISGNWIIDTAIRIPSNFTLILEDCHLKLADGCFSLVVKKQKNILKMTCL